MTLAARRLALAALALSAPALARAPFELHDADAAGVGLSDPTPAAPAPLNPGTTLGELRRNVLLEAARLWGERLDSDVTIHVDLSFAPLDCGDSVVLGAAGATMVFRNFPGAPVAGTWYPSALADSLAGVELDATTSDIVAQFNAAVDTDACLPGVRFYYGLDNLPPPGSLDLLAVALHELGHGLGMANFVNEASGAFIAGLPDIFSRHVFDVDQSLSWAQMTAPLRQVSAVNTRRVVWTGSRAQDQARLELLPTTAALSVEPRPSGFSGVVDAASFGPSLTDGAAPVQGELALTDPPDACGQVAPLAGAIALVQRGGCSFVQKALSVQAAGGVALLVRNLDSGSPPGGMTGTGDVYIPSLRLTASDGDALELALASGSVVAELFASQSPRGADASGHLMLHAPSPVEPGSSGSHWAPLAERGVRGNAATDLLMEPALSHGVHTLDMALAALADQGWAVAATSSPADAGASVDSSANLPGSTEPPADAGAPGPLDPGAGDGPMPPPDAAPGEPSDGDAAAPSSTTPAAAEPDASAGSQPPGGARPAIATEKPPEPPRPVPDSAAESPPPDAGAAATGAGGLQPPQAFRAPDASSGAPADAGVARAEDEARPGDVRFRRQAAPGAPDVSCSLAAPGARPGPVGLLALLGFGALGRRRGTVRPRRATPQLPPHGS